MLSLTKNQINGSLETPPSRLYVTLGKSNNSALGVLFRGSGSPWKADSAQDPVPSGCRPLLTIP